MSKTKIGVRRDPRLSRVQKVPPLKGLELLSYNMDALKSVRTPAPRTPEQELRSPQWYPASPPLPKLDPPPLSLGHPYNPSTGSDVRNQLDVLLNEVPFERKPYETHPVQQVQMQPLLSKHLEHLELLPEDRIFAKLKSWTGEEIAMFPCVAEFMRRKSGVCGHNFTHQPRMESAPSIAPEVHSAHWRENHEARKHGLYGNGNYGDYGKQDYEKRGNGYHPYHTVRSR
jgi:hypothetical protein